ncbi:CG0192-related protein [Dactylosporangium darangshiense]|uniref:Maltokinase N-terminal cap domain-containing protein n=1 Tax=Dactylosporangium darangshiense TaxID=579108 RepID=A0ABP8DJT5_9ACTN
MALLYRADLTPGKLDLIAGWLPGRPWYRGPAAPQPERVSAFRFDDPAGEVGVETILVRAEPDGPVYQIPLTYRDTPLPGAEAWLLGTSEHSVLGTRWIYDAAGDPVYAAVLAAAILAGGTEAAEEISTDEGLVSRTPAMSVRGTGTPGADVPAVTAVAAVKDADPTVITTDSLTLALARVLDGALPAGPALLWGERALAAVV